MSGIVAGYVGDIVRGTQEVLEASPLKRLVSPGMTVSVKPNMVLAKPPSSGATTHSEVVEGLLLYLRALGVRKIEIIESAWVGGNTKRAYHVCGYEALSQKYEAALIDLKDDAVCKVDTGEYRLEVCQKALKTDFLINVPVVKAHCQTRLTCCLKNLKGCIPDREKRRFHALGLHKPIAHLNKAIQTHFCLVDGICGDLTFEEGGNPVTRNMVLAGQDPVLLDSYGAGLIGLRVAEVDYIGMAARLGVGRLFSDETEISFLGRENKPRHTEKAGGLAGRLGAYVHEDQACSACYASLIHALHHAGRMPRSKISVGQGFRGQTGALGCGDCTARHARYVKGCPPSAIDIAAFLQDITR